MLRLLTWSALLSCPVQPRDSQRVTSESPCATGSRPSSSCRRCRGGREGREAAVPFGRGEGEVSARDAPGIRAFIPRRSSGQRAVRKDALLASKQTSNKQRHQAVPGTRRGRVAPSQQSGLCWPSSFRKQQKKQGPNGVLGSSRRSFGREERPSILQSSIGLAGPLILLSLARRKEGSRGLESHSLSSQTSLQVVSKSLKSGPELVLARCAEHGALDATATARVGSPP